MRATGNGDSDEEVADIAPSGSLGGDIVRNSSPFLSPSSRSSLVASSETNSATRGGSTPRRRVTLESLMARPRSNQRTRTPMRYESPLSPTAFRREPDEDVSPRREGQRVTVRPLAGTSVGTALQGRARVQRLGPERSITPVSSKQGPSQRKIRRWNNDNFVGIASELAKSSSRGGAAAQILLQAQAEAPMYKSIYDPSTRAPSEAFSNFMTAESMQQTREDFYECKIGCGSSEVQYSGKKHRDLPMKMSPELMMKRIHERLRKVVIRACTTSAESRRSIDNYEKFLVMCFKEGKIGKLRPEEMESLLELPTVTKRKSGQTIVRFYFDAHSTSGGFHRLLLHAVSRFHGLHAVSSTIEIEQKEKDTARLLTVTGSLSGSEFCLSDYASERHQNTPETPSSTVLQVADSLSTLQV